MWEWDHESGVDGCRAGGGRVVRPGDRGGRPVRLELGCADQDGRTAAIAGAAAGKEVYYVWEGSYTYTKEQAQASQGAPVHEGAAGDEGPIPFPVQQPLIEAKDAVQEDDDLQDQEDGAQDTGGLFFFFF